MKISELKQPYRRMAEYLAENNTDESFYNKELLIWSFNWHETHYKFWLEVYSHKHPKITEEIKAHFPADFDFSGEVLEIVNTNSLSNDGLSLNTIALKTYGKNFMELKPWEQSALDLKFE